jgi:hypothetical protein
MKQSEASVGTAFITLCSVQRKELPVCSGRVTEATDFSGEFKIRISLRILPRTRRRRRHLSIVGSIFCSCELHHRDFSVRGDFLAGRVIQLSRRIPEIPPESCDRARRLPIASKNVTTP